MYKFGVCARSEQFATALEREVDYVEPLIAGDLVKRDGDRWVRNPDYPSPGLAPSFAVLFPGELKLSDPDFPHEAITDYLAVTLDSVAAIAAPGARVVLGSGAARRIPEGVDAKAGAAAFARSLRTAAEMAKARGLQIILEPLNKRECNLLHTIAECAAFLDAHDIDVPIVADLYHMMLEGEPVEILRTHGARIGHAHLADTERVPPGQGDWPIAQFLKELEVCGYKGGVSIECPWKDFGAELPDALRFLRSAA